jgi:hypothetical protein
MYRCSDDLSFNLNDQEGKSNDVSMAFLNLKHSGGPMYRFSDGLFSSQTFRRANVSIKRWPLFQFKRSGGQMYRFIDGLSFILNIQEGKNVSM